MTNRRNVPIVLVVVSLLALPSAAWGLINLRFTPIHLADQSKTILMAKIKTKGIANEVELGVSAVLKGKAPARLVIDLSKASRK